MLIFALRLLAIAVLVLLYQVQPAVGIGAVAAGFAYLIARRVRRPAA